jgi:Fe2+ or Zn2+ uptake regulation protein
MAERLGHSVSLYQVYETFLDSERFQVALATVYYDTLTFLKEAKVIFLSRGVKTDFLYYLDLESIVNINRL